MRSGIVGCAGCRSPATGVGNWDFARADAAHCTEGGNVDETDAKNLIDWLESKRDDTRMTSPTYPWACGWNSCITVVEDHINLITRKEDK